jgi:hypothetical protein
VGAAATPEQADDAARAELAKQLRVRVSGFFEIQQSEWTRSVTSERRLEGQEVRASSAVQSYVDSVELRGAVPAARFTDGATHFTLMRLDLGARVRRAAEYFRLGDRARTQDDAVAAMRMQLRALGLLATVPEAAVDDRPLLPRVEAGLLDLVQSTRVDVQPREFDVRSSADLPATVRAHASVSGAPAAGMPLRAFFSSGRRANAVTAETDATGSAEIRLPALAGGMRQRTLIIEPDWASLAGDSTLPMPWLSGLAVAEISIRTPPIRTVAAVVEIQDGAVTSSSRLLGALTDRLTAGGYLVSELGPRAPASDADLVASARESGADYLVIARVIVSTLPPLTSYLAQASAQVSVSVLALATAETVAHAIAADVRGTGATDREARQRAGTRGMSAALDQLVLPGPT